MKVLLIDPPFYRFMGIFNRYFPFGLTCLAAVVRSSGHNVIIYDADFNDKPRDMRLAEMESLYGAYLEGINNSRHPLWQEARDVLLKEKPDVVGITIMTTKAASAFRTAELAKRVLPGCIVVAGGPHATIAPEETLCVCKNIDYVIRGEGENSFTKLLSVLEKRESSLMDSIDGLCFRKNGRIIVKTIASPIPDLDTMPFPARDLLMHGMSYIAEDMGLIMTSRGCPYKCTFCASAGIWGHTTRFRSIDSVIEEIGSIRQQYGTRQFTFKDDTFTLSRERITRFCRALAGSGTRIAWDCNSRANLVDLPILRTMRKAGCNSIKMGVESGSERVLKILNKGISLKDIEQASSALRKSGIHWTGYFMMGLPTESKEEMLSTLRIMKRIRPPFASLSVYEVFPGTELFDLGVELDLVKETLSLNDFYSIKPHLLYYADPEVRSDKLNREQFVKLELQMKAAFHKYNRNPARIFERVISRKSLYASDLRAIAADFKKFIAWF